MNPRLRAAIIAARAADLTIAADRSFAPNRNSLKWNRRRQPAAAARCRRRERVALLTESARACARVTATKVRNILVDITMQQTLFFVSEVP